MSDKKVLLLSVGGSTEQTVASLKLNNCEHVIFFCSNDTYKYPKIAMELISDAYRPLDYERIVTENPDDLNECYRTLETRLPRILKLWMLGMNNIITDYTGGTKSMTAALVLSTVMECERYSYIGGVKRAKEGVGIVLTGSEKHYYLDNPWKVLGVKEAALVDMMFDRCQFQLAANTLNKMANSVDHKLKTVFAMLSKVSLAYNYWDSFMHSKAYNQLKQSIYDFRNMKIRCIPSFVEMIEKFEKGEEWLRTVNELNISIRESLKRKTITRCENSASVTAENGIVDEGTGHSTKPSISKEESLLRRYKLIDLISNAKRRAEKENRYDDAVARLYSALEKYVKARLLEHGIDNSRAGLEDIPEAIRAQYEKYLYKDEKTGQELLKFGLVQSCELLAEINPTFKEMYGAHKGSLDKIIIKRNNSILAHGDDPVSGTEFNDLLNITLKFTEIKECDLLSFPSLNLPDWCSKMLS